MRMRLFILASVLMATGTVLAQAYRWVDDDGIVHYSDVPREGAERIELPGDNRVTRNQRPTRAPAARSQGADNQQAQAAAFKYESITVDSPAPGETLWNIEGVLNVNLAIRPALREGHQVRVYFDGNSRMVDSTSFRIEDVYRGMHNLQAEVVDATGKLMIRSVPNRFYVQQTSVN